MLYNETRKKPTLSICALLLSIGSIVLFIYPQSINFANIIGPFLFFVGLILSIASLKQSSKAMACVSFLCLFIVLTMATKSVLSVYSTMPTTTESTIDL